MEKTPDHTTLTRQHTIKVLGNEALSASAFVLSLEREDFAFRAGQCVLLGLPGKQEMREYSIYSPVDSDRIEVLVKTVEDGRVSRQLGRCRPGDALIIEGPIGYFTLRDADIQNRSFTMIATGTGIAPFHCMTQSYPGLDYRLLHGVRVADDAYAHEKFPEARYVLCTSQDEKGAYHGRVTAYLRDHAPDPEQLFLLCGNVKMIDDVCDLLDAAGVPTDNVRTEVYF
jgi:ferredoxin--NADP+ reductase/benzoate/toluate 1,2-dioxygenase reductase subunit